MIHDRETEKQQEKKRSVCEETHEHDKSHGNGNNSNNSNSNTTNTSNTPPPRTPAPAPQLLLGIPQISPATPHLALSKTTTAMITINHPTTANLPALSTPAPTARSKPVKLLVQRPTTPDPWRDGGDTLIVISAEYRHLRERPTLTKIATPTSSLPSLLKLLLHTTPHLALSKMVAMRESSSSWLNTVTFRRPTSRTSTRAQDPISSGVGAPMRTRAVACTALQIRRSSHLLCTLTTIISYFSMKCMHMSLTCCFARARVGWDGFCVVLDDIRCVLRCFGYDRMEYDEVLHYVGWDGMGFYWIGWDRARCSES